MQEKQLEFVNCQNSHEINFFFKYQGFDIRAFTAFIDTSMKKLLQYNLFLKLFAFLFLLIFWSFALFIQTEIFLKLGEKKVYKNCK